jgi:hypothetical protein
VKRDLETVIKIMNTPTLDTPVRPGAIEPPGLVPERGKRQALMHLKVRPRIDSEEKP